MSYRLKGFSNLTYEGHPVFIKEEYEKVWKNSSEFEKLSTYLGYSTTSMNALLDYAKSIEPKLLYHHYSETLDLQLERKYGNKCSQWISFESGWLNIITYEYVRFASKPNRVSKPFWSNYVTLNYNSPSKVQSESLIELGLYFLIGLIGGLKG